MRGADTGRGRSSGGGRRAGARVRRAGAHGAGMWGLPGGHQEFGESPERTAVREVAEETGLVVRDARLGFTDDPMPEIGRHYVTLFVACTRTGRQPRLMEPDKATELAWLTPTSCGRAGTSCSCRCGAAWTPVCWTSRGREGEALPGRIGLTVRPLCWGSGWPDRGQLRSRSPPSPRSRRRWRPCRAGAPPAAPTCRPPADPRRRARAARRPRPGPSRRSR